MKDRKTWAAAALGLLAGLSHWFYLDAVESEVRGGRPVTVLVAAEKIAAGEKAEKRKLAVRELPAACSDSRSVPAASAAEIRDLAASVDVEAGQIVAWSDFARRRDPGADDLAAFVESGRRAITVKADGVLAMDGLLKPGHRVDILGTFARGDRAKKDKVTVTLLQNVPVLATGARLGAEGHGDGKERFSTVTLGVEIEEAELLSLARNEGSLSLVLRGRQDLSVVRDVPEKGMADVWDAERRSALQGRAAGRGEPGIERIRAR